MFWVFVCLSSWPFIYLFVLSLQVMHKYSLVFQFYLFVYLRGERKRGGEGVLLSAGSPPQIPTEAEAEPGQLWELGTQSGSPTWVVGTQWLGPSLQTSRVCITRELESGTRAMSQTHVLLTRILTTILNACPYILILNNWNNTKVCNKEDHSSFPSPSYYDLLGK